MRRNFPVSEKSVNFEQTGKVRENHIKYWKTQGISDKCYLIFLVIFKLTLYYLLKWIKFSVKKQNIKKNTEKMGIMCAETFHIGCVWDQDRTLKSH